MVFGKGGAWTRRIPPQVLGAAEPNAEDRHGDLTVTRARKERDVRPPHARG